MNQVAFTKTSILHMINIAEEEWKSQSDKKQTYEQSAERIPSQNDLTIHREYILLPPTPSMDFSSHKTKIVHIHNNEQSSTKTEKEKKEENANFSKVIGSVITVIGSFFAGYVYRSYGQQKAALHATEAFDKILQENQAHPLFEDLHAFVIHKLSIDTLNATRINGYALSTLGIVISGGFLALGGFTAASSLITIGQIFLLGSSGTAAYTLGAHWNSGKKIQHHYRAIFGEGGNSLGSRIKEQLESYTEDMEIHPSAPLFREDSYGEPPPAYEEEYA